MTFRNILVPTAGRPECALALDKTKVEAARALFEESARKHNLPMLRRPHGGSEPSPEMPGTPEHVMPIVGRLEKEWSEDTPQQLMPGLPLARILAEGCGGELAIESEPGRGTTASIILPK